jgi:hypothetical protein
MTNTENPQQKKTRPPITTNGLIMVFNNIRSKIDAAAGAATFLELHLRAIAQLNPRVQIELRRVQAERGIKKPKCYHQADLNYLIDAVIGVFRDKLAPEEQDVLKSCRVPRNKTSHGSFAELMIELNGEAPGREIDPTTGKRKPLAEDDIVEAAICIEWNGGLEEFTKRADKAVALIQEKVLRPLPLSP